MPSPRRYPADQQTSSSSPLSRLSSSSSSSSSSSYSSSSGTQTNSGMDNAGILVLPAANTALMTSSRLAVFCIAHFVFGFAAGLLFARYRSRATSEAPCGQNETSSTGRGPAVARKSSASRESADSTDGDASDASDASDVSGERLLSDAGLESMRTDAVEEAALLNADTVSLSTTSPKEIDLSSDAKPGSCVTTPRLEVESETLLPPSTIAAESPAHTNDSTDGQSANTATMRISRILVYPIKGCAPLELQSARVMPYGLENDRMFMVVDFTGRDLNQKKYPILSLARVTYLPDGDMRLEAPKVRTVVFAPRTKGSKQMVSSHGVQCEAVDQGDSAADFFAQLLEIAGVRLVHMREGFVRQGRGGGFETSFADVYPCLFATESSRKRVEEWVGRKMVMLRFRPNVVIDGASMVPFEEDGWKKVVAGRCNFEVAKACVRCKVVTVDPEKGMFDEDNQPKAALERHRRFGCTVRFGQNVIPRDLDGGDGDVIRVGDAIEVVDRLDEVPVPDVVNEE